MTQKARNFSYALPQINPSQLTPGIPLSVKTGLKTNGWIKCVNGSPVYVDLYFSGGRVEPLPSESIDIYEVSQDDTIFQILAQHVPAFSTFANTNLNIYVYPYNKPDGVFPAALATTNISSTINAGRVPGLKVYNADVSAGGTFSIILPSGFSLFCVSIDLSFSIPAANAGGNFTVSRLDGSFFPNSITWRTSGGPNMPGRVDIPLLGPLKGVQTVDTQLSGMDFTVPAFSTNMWLNVFYYTVAGI